MKEVYDYAVLGSNSAQTENEQKIYDTPCEDDGDYGPIYTEPPMAVEKIYETFEGKRFRKLHHQNIRYILVGVIRNTIQENLQLLVLCTLLTQYRAT